MAELVPGWVLVLARVLAVNSGLWELGGAFQLRSYRVEGVGELGNQRGEPSWRRLQLRFNNACADRELRQVVLSRRSRMSSGALKSSLVCIYCTVLEARRPSGDPEICAEARSSSRPGRRILLVQAALET